MSTVDSYLSDLKEILSEVPATGALPDNVNDIIDESEQLLEQLKIEVHSVTNKDQKQRVLTQMRSYQSEIESIKRRQLTGNNNSGAPLTEDERHNQNMARLHEARQQLHDSEVLAQQTIENLDQQEETMRRTTGNLKQTNSELSTANKLLTRMSKWWRG